MPFVTFETLCLINEGKYTEVPFSFIASAASSDGNSSKFSKQSSPPSYSDESVSCTVTENFLCGVS